MPPTPALSRLAGKYARTLTVIEARALASAIEVADNLADVAEPWQSRLRDFASTAPPQWLPLIKETL